MKKKLKILQVVPYFYPAWAYGGIPRVAYELSRELVRRGHEVTVYTTDVLDKDKRLNNAALDTDIDGIKVHYFKNISNKLAYDMQLYLPGKMIGKANREVAGFDIIHMHGHRHLLNNIVRRSAVKAGIPYILSGHGTVLRIERRQTAKMIFDKVFGDNVLRDAVGFVAVSENEVGQYEEFGIPKEKVRVVYNGIDVDAYKRLPKKGSFRKKYGLGDKEVVLYLGKITPRKGIDFLIRAFAKLKRPQAVLVIAGNDMGFKEQLERIIREKDLAERVIFTGLLIDDEKLSAYKDADMLVYPAIYEIFGLVPFEALMCNTPVIVTDDCGCGDIIGGEGIGYLVKYNDDKGLAAKINEVLDNKAEAMEKVKKGKNYIKNKLAWKSVVKQYEKVYEEFAS